MRVTRDKLTTLLISTIVSVLVFEGVVRLFIEPSPVSYGRLLWRELPPLRIVPERGTAPAGDAPVEGAAHADKPTDAGRPRS